MLCSLSTHLAIHPIHALVEPVPCHECHTLLQLAQHVHQLRASRPHAHHHLAPLLTHGSCESEIATTDVEPLRESELLVAVNGGTRTGVEITAMGFGLWVTPLVARPIWVAIVIVSACVVRDLLHNLVALVHVELMATTQAWEALSVTVPITILADRMPRHTDQVEVQIATARWPISLEINVNTERLPREDGLVEVGAVAVISGRTPHEVESVRRSIPHGPATINGSCTWEVVRVVNSIFIDDNGACLSSHQRLPFAEIRLAVQCEAWSWRA